MSSLIKTLVQTYGMDQTLHGTELDLQCYQPVVLEGSSYEAGFLLGDKASRVIAPE